MCICLSGDREIGRDRRTEIAETGRCDHTKPVLHDLVGKGKSLIISPACSVYRKNHWSIAALRILDRSRRRLHKTCALGQGCTRATQVLMESESGNCGAPAKAVPAINNMVLPSDMSPLTPQNRLERAAR